MFRMRSTSSTTSSARARRQCGGRPVQESRAARRSAAHSSTAEPPAYLLPIIMRRGRAPDGTRSDIMKLKITTFNVENLFNRYAFLDLPFDQKNYEKFIMARGLVSLASRKGDLVPVSTTDTQRTNTALAVQEADPDVLAVCEIENLYTLRNFNSAYLKNGYDRMISIDGNDLRGIDVGLLIR